jgi:hypothetical protein
MKKIAQSQKSNRNMFYLLALPKRERGKKRKKKDVIFIQSHILKNVHKILL